jgi:hypothetical protein
MLVPGFAAALLVQARSRLDGCPQLEQGGLKLSPVRFDYPRAQFANALI